MKSKIMMIAITATILIGSINYAKADIKREDPATNSCTTQSLIHVIFEKFGMDIGSSCSISCPSGTKAVCNSGLFSSDCHCDNLNPGQRLIPSNLTSQSMQAANAFASFCNLSPSNDLQILGTITQDVITSVVNNNSANFDAYENQWSDQYNNLSQSDKDAIDSWINNYQI